MAVVPAETQNKATLYFLVPAVDNCPFQVCVAPTFSYLGTPFCLRVYLVNIGLNACGCLPVQVYVYVCIHACV